MRLYIAEKPELGRAIADAISDKQFRKNGYILVGENNIVTWCFGHLLALKDPHEYNEDYKKWKLDTLPFNIKEYQLKPIPGKEKQIAIIKDLIKKADEVVNAGDPDDEGQLLVDELLDHLKYKGKVLRVLINDNTKEAVKKALSNLKNNIDFKPLKDSAYYRSISDYEYGMNLTRAYTILNSMKMPFKKGQKPPVLSVGRVQTPVLNLIFKREQEVEKHIKQKYYNLYADNIFKYEIAKDKLENKICVDKSHLEDIKTQSETCNDFKISNVDVKENIQYSPLVYNLLELQADAYKEYKYSPDKVKDITQRLRETHKAITYNRSDCQYLSSEHYSQRKDLISSILKNLNAIDKYKNLNTCLNLEQKHKTFNDENITAHHGIIPTINNLNLDSFNQEGKNIFLMIANRYLMLFMKPKITEKTSYIAKNSKHLCYIASKTIIIDKGYTTFENTEFQENENADFNYKEGNLLNFKDFTIKESETKPKQLYTFATLLKDLTAVAKYIEDPNLKKILIERDKDKKGESGGIGTPATRDTIIKLLIDRGFIEENKGKLITTKIGKDFLANLSSSAKTPDMTALWSYKQKDIKDGKLTYTDAISEVKQFIKDEVARLKSQASNK